MKALHLAWAVGPCQSRVAFDGQSNSVHTCKLHNDALVPVILHHELTTGECRWLNGLTPAFNEYMTHAWVPSSMSQASISCHWHENQQDCTSKQLHSTLAYSEMPALKQVNFRRSVPVYAKVNESRCRSVLLIW